MLLVRDIAAAAEATDWMSLDSFRTLTHVRGTRNAHLAEPDSFDRRTGYQRRSPLPLDAQVHGAFVTLVYCGHEPYALLEDHESLAAVEKLILAGVGITNFFTDFLLAFVDGKLRSYEVRDDRGQLVAKDGLRAAEWQKEPDAIDGPDCRVIWAGG